MSDATQRVYGKICGHLDEIRKSFVPEIKLTFIARLPGNDEADMVVGDDDIDEAIKALERRKEDEGTDKPSGSMEVLVMVNNGEPSTYDGERFISEINGLTFRTVEDAKEDAFCYADELLRDIPLPKEAIVAVVEVSNLRFCKAQIGNYPPPNIEVPAHFEMDAEFKGCEVFSEDMEEPEFIDAIEIEEVN